MLLIFRTNEICNIASPVNHGSFHHWYKILARKTPPLPEKYALETNLSWNQHCKGPCRGEEGLHNEKDVLFN